VEQSWHCTRPAQLLQQATVRVQRLLNALQLLPLLLTCHSLPQAVCVQLTEEAPEHSTVLQHGMKQAGNIHTTNPRPLELLT
jgi:hypothetical protein